MKDRCRRRKQEAVSVLGVLWAGGDTEMDAVGSWRWGDAVMIRSQIYPWAPFPPTHQPTCPKPWGRREGRTALVNGNHCQSSDELRKGRSSGLWESQRKNCGPMYLSGDLCLFVSHCECLKNMVKEGSGQRQDDKCRCNVKATPWKFWPKYIMNVNCSSLSLS